MSKYFKEFWACSGCGEAHEFLDEAKDCCAPQKVNRYICPECKTDWMTNEEAKTCHESCEKNHMAKLEAAGQMRLID